MVSEVKPSREKPGTCYRIDERLTGSPERDPRFLEDDPVVRVDLFRAAHVCTYRFEDVKRGDVIVFRYPDDVSRRFIKRVVGLPGDTVEIREGKVSVNGEVLEEPYLDEDLDRPHRKLPKVTVPEHSYYVLGDHRSISSDSRGGWFVPRENIIGKAALRFWPLRKFAVI